MSIVVLHKKLICIEWTVKAVQTVQNSSVIDSERFRFQDCECSFQLYSPYNDYSDAFLYLKSNGKLNPKIDIFVFSRYSCEENTKQPITNGKQQIWRHRGTALLNILLNFVIIFSDDPSTDDKLIQTPSYMDTRFLLEGVSKDFSKLFDDGPNYDVRVVCEDGEVPVHKNVLCCRSSVFERMLQSDMVEGKTGQINIQDMDVTLLQQFLRILYTGTLPRLTVDTAMQFYTASDKYAVDTLKQQCSEFLIDNLSLENACEILIMADHHSDPDLKKSIMEYIFEEKIPIVGEKWTDFCNENQKLAVEVLNSFCQHLCSK